MTDALREKLVDADRMLVSEDQGHYVAGHGDDLQQKGRRANSTDLHTNVFDDLVRRWKCRHCHQDDVRGADPSGHSSCA